MHTYNYVTKNIIIKKYRIKFLFEMYIIAQVLLGSYVVYLFLGMQMIVLNIIYGWVVITLCIDISLVTI